MSHSSPRMGDLLPNTHSCCPPSSNHPQQNLKADIIIKGRWKIWCLVNKKCSQIYSLNLNLRLCAYVWFTKDAERGKETNLGFFFKKKIWFIHLFISFKSPETDNTCLVCVSLPPAQMRVQSRRASKERTKLFWKTRSQRWQKTTEARRHESFSVSNVYSPGVKVKCIVGLFLMWKSS